MVIGRVKFIVSTTLPKPNEVDYWIDVLEDPYGSVIRTWNGVEWRRLDQDTIDAIEKFSLQLLQLDEKLNNTIIELNTLTGEVRVLLDNLEQHVTNLDNPHNVTKEQVGLENVDNTSDMDKPVSTAVLEALDSHTTNTNNPHSVTKELIGLGNCNNTSDLDKPISNAAQNEFNTIKQSITQHVSNTDNPHNVTKELIGLKNLTNDALVKRDEMGTANGVATLNEQGLVPSSQLPSYVDDVIDCYATYNKAEDGTLTNIRLYLDSEHQNAISGESGKIYVDITNSELITSSAYQFRWTGTQFAVVGAPTVIGEVTGTAFDGKRGKDLEDKTNAHIGNISNPHNVTKALIGLLNVDNTSDANKPISNATQSALDNKLNTLVSGTNIKTLNGESLLGSGDILIQSGGVGKVDTNSDGTGEIFNDYQNNRATGNYAHAEGYRTIASGNGAHAEGFVSKTEIFSGRIEASGNGSHASGYTGSTGRIEATNAGSYAAGYSNSAIIASGEGSHAEGFSRGRQIRASRYGSYALGFSDGNDIVSSGDGSHALNVSTTANTYAQTAIGCNNIPEEIPSPTVYNAEKIAFVIGNGTKSVTSNAFKVLFNGQTFADGEYSSAGADYAEMFEWKDGNPNNEDRVGRFVTLKGKNIEIANKTSTYILGIVSGAPTIIGDNPMRWQGKYLNDEWGRPIYEDIEVTYTEYERQVDGTFKEIEKTRIDHVRKLNPLYNSQEKYIPRAERQEWDYVGMMGKLLVKQDGTLTEGGFCKSGANGIATKANNGYYVMDVINNEQALILFR